MTTSTMTSKGQIVIPKIIRDQLGLKPGDKLDFILQKNGDLVIRPTTHDVRDLKGLLQHSGGKTEKTIKNQKGTPE